MSFWVQATEPLRKNRWKMVFGNELGLPQYTYALKKCDKPSYKTTDITHKFGNYSWYYPGRVEWNTINVTFASVPTLDTVLLNILKGAGFAAPADEQLALKGVTKKQFSDVLGKITVAQLAADGGTIEEWDLVYPFFTNIKFGDLSYDSEEIVDIECTIRFDTANYKQVGAELP